jgi:hypothetical protein
MKRTSKVEQFTPLLMVPIDQERAKRLAYDLANPAPVSAKVWTWHDIHAAQLELLLGIAAVQDDEERQLTAHAAASAIFRHVPKSAEALQSYVLSIYEKRRAESEQA